MKFPTAIGVIITVLLISYFTIPKNINHEKQIKALAYSYGIYYPNVCPNDHKLDKLKDEYERYENPPQKDKEWIDQNFKQIFEKECLQHEVERARK